YHSSILINTISHTHIQAHLVTRYLPVLQLHCQPPTSTLFPYTTLFRSPPSCSADPSIELPPPTDPSSTRRWVSPHTLRGGLRERDRKSTRLNSSHVSISYAVFCLKKKKVILRTYDYKWHECPLEEHAAT